MLLYILIAAIVLIGAVVARFAEDHLDNGVEHHQQDAPLEEDPGELEFAA